MKKLVNVLEVLFLVMMIGLCVIVFMAGNGKVPYVFGYRILSVVSNSMSPTIENETCIVIKKVEAEDIEVGDIITFVSEAADIKGYLNTHRVYAIETDETTGENIYITKGDAYGQPDLDPVDFEQVAGEYVGELPMGKTLFKAIRFLADRNNYFVIVILPLFCCFASYAKQLWNAITRKEKDEEEDDDEDDELEEIVKPKKSKKSGDSEKTVKSKKSAEPEKKSKPKKPAEPKQTDESDEAEELEEDELEADDFEADEYEAEELETEDIEAEEVETDELEGSND